MKISKYIFKITIINTLISTLVIIGIVWLSQSFRSIKFILEKGGNISDFFKLSFLSLPSWLSIAMSFGVFFGIYLSYLKLENDQEIVVMKSSGLSAFQISKPAILISLIASFLLFLNIHCLSPLSYTLFKDFQNDVRYRTPEIIINETTFFDIDKNKTIYFNKKVNSTKVLDVFIQDRTDTQEVKELFAKEGTFFSENNEIFLILKNGTKIISSHQQAPTIIEFEVNTINLKGKILQTENQNEEKKIIDVQNKRFVENQELSFFELIKKGNMKQNERGKYLSEAHTRNINSFLPLTFSFIVLIFLLLSNFSRHNSTLKKIIIFSLVFSTQTITIVLKNLITKNLDFLPILYFVPILITSVCFFCLLYEQNVSITLHKLKQKNV